MDDVKEALAFLIVCLAFVALAVASKWVSLLEAGCTP